MIAELIQEILRILSDFFEMVGGVIVILGGLQATWYLIVNEIKRSGTDKIEKVRYIIGHKIIIGIEFFVIGDILGTIIAPSWDAIGKLAALIAIRTALSYFLQWEIQRKKHFTD